MSIWKLLVKGRNHLMFLRLSFSNALIDFIVPMNTVVQLSFFYSSINPHAAVLIPAIR
jgi:hypothetical protein